MASRTQDTLYDSFAAVANSVLATMQAATTRSGARDDSALESAVSNALTGGLAGGGIGSVVQQATGLSSSQGGGGVLSTIASVFTSGLGLVPLLSGLFGLFGGGSDQPPPLVKYTMPDRIFFQGAETGTGISPMDYDQTGMPRVAGTGPNTANSRGGISATAPQITVNVQAMDSRSFLDHSTEIAQAVRQAMLTLNSINDVVSEL